jgi:hypothetical protein
MHRNCKTAKEAGSMFCGPYVSDHEGMQTEVAYCNADRCMMWRWVEVDEREGYCGRGGKP